jgi:hypothetical protein
VSAQTEDEPQVDTRGQITVPLGDADYLLRPSREALSAIEKKLGRSLLVIAGQAVNGSLSVEDMAIICVEMMKAQGKADPKSGPSYSGAKVEKIADLIFEQGTPSITARLVVLLMGAVTGGYTASGEVKPTM